MKCLFKNPYMDSIIYFFLRVVFFWKHKFQNLKLSDTVRKVPDWELKREGQYPELVLPSVDSISFIKMLGQNRSLSGPWAPAPDECTAPPSCVSLRYGSLDQLLCLSEYRFTPFQRRCSWDEKCCWHWSQSFRGSSCHNRLISLEADGWLFIHSTSNVLIC